MKCQKLKIDVFNGVYEVNASMSFKKLKKNVKSCTLLDTLI
jgi:hypothetical protein